MRVIATSQISLITPFLRQLVLLPSCPSLAFIPPLSHSRFLQTSQSKVAAPSSSTITSSTTSINLSSTTIPSITETIAAAHTIQTLLSKELIKPPKVRNAQTSHDLLGNLHSIALALLKYNDITSTKRAVELFRYSLDNFYEDVGVRERLSAALRSLGRLDESARELFRVIDTLECTGGVNDSILCMLYLDLGALIDESMPLPGAGYEILDPILNEDDAPKFVFDREVDGGGAVSLSCFDCYRKAVCLDPECGLAHKKLADILDVIRKHDEALGEFEVAARSMPEDICCATHLHFASRTESSGPGAVKHAIPLTGDATVEKTLGEISSDAKKLMNTESLADLARKFEMNGVLVFPKLLSEKDVDVLSKKVLDIISLASRDDDCEVADLTDETKAANQRIHMALPLSDDEQYTTVISSVMSRLHPLLTSILQCNDSGRIPLIGSGFMQTSPGAKAQDLHKDVHHWDRHGSFDDIPSSWGYSLNGSPRCISIQLQLTDTTIGGEMGSLQVLPGSHRPDTKNGSPSVIARAVKDTSTQNGVIPLTVLPGTVTMYSSRLWHCGGANDSDTDRRFCFFTVTEDNTERAPPGLIHTMQMNDIGKWCVTKHGLAKS
ncbi:hypothetical protein ACHAXN_002780 [Cyclotella atomus]